MAIGGALEGLRIGRADALAQPRHEGGFIFGWCAPCNALQRFRPKWSETRPPSFIGWPWFYEMVARGAGRRTTKRTATFTTESKIIAAKPVVASLSGSLSNVGSRPSTG